MIERKRSQNKWGRDLIMPILRPLALYLVLQLIYGRVAMPQAIRLPKLECTQITLKVSLTAGQNYEQPIGRDFTLNVLANSTPPNGWTFTLDGPSGDDYIAPVNPPLRSNPTQILGPAYGFTARDSLKIDRRIRFILGEADYKRIEQLWHYALWPGNAPNPDHAADDYVTAIKQLRAGWLRVKTVESDISPDDIVRSATFIWEITAPSEFHFNPALKPKAVVCPAAGE